MKNKQVLSEFMNLLSIILVIFGIFFSLFYFDLKLVEDYYEAKGIAEFSNESEFLQTYVDTFKKKMLANIFGSVLIFLITIVISVNLWFKSFRLFEEVEKEYEQEIEIEENEESRV